MDNKYYYEYPHPYSWNATPRQKKNVESKKEKPRTTPTGDNNFNNFDHHILSHYSLSVNNRASPSVHKRQQHSKKKKPTHRINELYLGHVC